MAGMEHGLQISVKDSPHFRWKIKWRLKLLGALGIKSESETGSLKSPTRT